MLFVLLLILLSCKQSSNTSTDMVFRYNNNLPVVSVTINGVHARLLVDSGASSSIIDSTTIDYYKFETYNGENVYFEGIGGGKQSLSVKRAVVKYGGSIIPIEFKAMDIKRLRETVGVSGVIGSDYLRKNNLVIDYGNRIIYKSNRQL